MGWFDEQIRQRKKDDADFLSETLYDIANAVHGEKSFCHSGSAKNEIEKIMEYYGVKSRDLPLSIKDIDAQIEYITRPHGIMKRKVTLKSGWYKNALYPMLAKAKDGAYKALIPGKISGYRYTESISGQFVRVTKKREAFFEDTAYCFYKPYSKDKLTEKELVKSIFGAVKLTDVALLTVISVLTVIISLAVASIYKVLFTYIATGKEIRPLLYTSMELISMAIGVNLMSIVKRLLSGKINNILQLSCESAIIIRVLSLPTSFFKKYNAGELSSKMQSVDELCKSISQSVISLGLTTVLSFAYFVWIGMFIPSLVLPSATTTFLTIILSVAVILSVSKQKKKRSILDAEEQGISYSLISGVSKIKLVGGEMRAFSKWGKKCAEKARVVYNPSVIVKIKNAVYTLINVFGNAWIYTSAVKGTVSVADFYAFTVAYGAVSGAVFSFFCDCDKLSDLKPMIENIMTFFEVKSEISDDKQAVTHLSGGIELNNVTFGFDESKIIFKNLSLKIRPGEYVAVVGKTGCGKSTLIRILLGFETPQKGSVYYDGKDISKLDTKSLRQKIGFVMQNGKLFPGDIFSNIAISSPNLTHEEAWAAADSAGIGDDIRKMPMGMNTIISEGGGGISGGQRQRILIARAIASKPRIILFDEATSALDNITQKTVSNTLDGMKCTRIIIAHRLSTIKNCSRIILIDDGKIAEDGTYDELIKKDGLFANLVRRQEVL